MRNKHFDFIGNETAFRTDGNGHRTLEIARTWGGCRRMRNKRKRPVNKRWKLIFNERFE